MEKQVILGAVAASLSLLLSPVSATAQAPAANSLEELYAEVVHAEDIQAIKRLTNVYGYYRDALRRDDMLTLFTDDASYDTGNGKYIGKGSIERLFKGDRFDLPLANLADGDLKGKLNEHVMMQGVITIAPDGLAAKARFKDFAFQAISKESQTYSVGQYENSYRKVDGVWMIQEIRHCYRLKMPYDASSVSFPKSPVYTRVPQFYPEDPNGPDRQSPYACHLYPDAGVDPPLHFDHPVTGERLQKP
ncbi:MAG: nuclear transport factor 2 family protein [Croceibacterium sp.]